MATIEQRTGRDGQQVYRVKVWRKGQLRSSAKVTLSGKEGYHEQRVSHQTQPAWTRRLRGGAHENPEAIICPTAHHLST